MDYETLKKYANQLKRHHYLIKKQVVGTIDVDEMVSESYARGFNSLDEAKKHIRDYFLTEARRLKAKSNTYDNASFFKKCSKCKEQKDSSLYRQRIDNKTGLYYLYYICKDCEKKYSSSKKVRDYENNRIKNNPELRKKKSEYERKRRQKIKMSKK